MHIILILKRYQIIFSLVLERVSDYEEYIDKEFRQCDKVVSNHGNHQGRSYLSSAGAQVAMIQLRTALNKIPITEHSQEQQN